MQKKKIDEQKKGSNIHTSDNRVKSLSMPEADKNLDFTMIKYLVLSCQTLGYINFIIFLFHYTRDIDVTK